MRIVFFLFLAAGSALADESSCLVSLQNCFESSYYSVQKLIKDLTAASIEESCELYSKALTCMDSLKCEKGTEFATKKEEYTKKFLKYVEGACLPDGSVDDCAAQEFKCFARFKDSERRLLKKDIKSACAEVIAFDLCVEGSKKVCPKSEVYDIIKQEQKLNLDNHRAGCDADCNSVLKNCVYKTQNAKKEDFCSAFTESKQCLADAVSKDGCKSTASQKYLKVAQNIETTEYKLKCSAPSSTQLSIALLAFAFLAALFGR